MANNFCPDCGATLLAASAGSPCPNCLLHLGFGAGPQAENGNGANVPGAGFKAAAAGLNKQSTVMAGSEEAGSRVGRYKLLEVIGEGGFGTVWMAEQQEPVRRKVALKIIKLGMDTRQVVARFEAERQALALMDHPHIARVFDGGATQSGRPYFVMELVRGVPLTSFCDARQLTTKERIELFVPVCQAVQHAHQKGIIHRDLKPSNILVTEQDGRPVPKVIDFGIAKATEAELTDKTLFTRFNQMIGTPAYMSPEQAGLGSLDIDTRTDIYSLGVLLYELLTGQTPLDLQKWRALHHEEILRQIREIDAPRPSTQLSTLKRKDLVSLSSLRREDPHHLCRIVRGDLDWIVLKALEKDRTRRYESANGLAADLRRFLDNEPIAARPPSNLYRLQKLARRNKLLFGAVGAVGIALLAGLITTTWQMVHARRNLAQARLNAYAAEINLAQQALSENNLARAVELLEQQRPRSGETDLRGFEWRYLWQQCQGNELAVFDDATRSGYPECAVAFSPDGRFLTYGGSEGTVIRDARNQQIVTNLPPRPSTLAFYPGGRLLAIAEPWSPKVGLWDTSTWQETRQLDNAGTPVVFSPDGRWLVSGSADRKQLQLWSTETWMVVAVCSNTPILLDSLRFAVAFSPDSKLLVTPHMDVRKTEGAGLLLWEVPSLEKRAELFQPEIPLQCAAFLSESNLVTAGWLGHLLVWDVKSNPPRVIQTEREHTTYVPGISVAPGGRTFVTGSADQSICLWDSSTRKRLARWRGHKREVWAVAASADGTTLASSSPDGSVRLWRGQPHDTGEVWDDAGVIAGFTDDGHTVVFAPSDVDYRWQLVTGTNRSIIPIPPTPPIKIDFEMPYDVTGSKPLAALGRTEGTVELWDLRARQLVSSWSAGEKRIITAVAFSSDGAMLATGDDAGIVRIWDIATRAQLAQLTNVNNYFVQTVAFSPDGKLLAAGSNGALETRVWSVGTGKQLLSLPVPAHRIAFAPDGKSLVTVSVGANEVQIWETLSGRHKTALKGHLGGTTQVTFSPDGLTLATGAYDGRIKLWNVATGREVATFPYPGMITALRFSPDGRTLAASFWMSPGYRAQLFRAPSLRK